MGDCKSGSAEFFAVEPVSFLEETIEEFIEFPSEFVELDELPMIPRPSFPRVLPPREAPGVVDHQGIKRMLREWL